MANQQEPSESPEPFEDELAGEDIEQLSDNLRHIYHQEVVAIARSLSRAHARLQAYERTKPSVSPAADPSPRSFQPLSSTPKGLHNMKTLKTTIQTPDIDTTSPRRRSAALAPSRLTGIAAILATGLLLTGALWGFQYFHSQAKPGSAVRPRATSTPVPIKNWSPVTQLTFSGNPTIAPSDSRAIYEGVSENTTSLRRTIDGGATWQALPIPFQVVSGIPLSASPMLGNWPNILQFLVSPLNPNVVWLQTNYRALLPANCLAQVSGLTGIQSSRANSVNVLASEVPGTTLSGQINPPCIVQFFSADGGQHWTQTTPTTVFAVGRVDPPSIWVQGQRLYARAWVNALSSPMNATYLMTSLDGGATWRNTSESITDPICAASPAPTGRTVFAITDTSNDCSSDSKIWRSDDAGQHWMLVSHLNVGPEQMYAAVGSDQTRPIVYLFGVETAPADYNATTLLVSLDGGYNWKAAPTPSNQPNLLGALEGYTALTSDGRLIAEFSVDENQNDGLLYSWKAGDLQWSPIGPAPQTYDPTKWALFFLAIPSLSGEPDALWYVNNPSGLTMKFYHLQL